MPYLTTTKNPNEINVSSDHGWNYTLHEVHTFNSSLIAEGVFSRNVGTQLTNLLYPSAPANFAQTLVGAGFSSGFLTGFAGPTPAIIPQILVTGYLGDDQKTYQSQGFSNIWEYGGSVTKVLGKHSIKAGVTASSDNYDGFTNQAAESTTTGATSNLLSAKNTGNALASFLIGVPATAIRKNNDNVTRHGWVYETYAQDQFQVTNNLAINYGVRWDLVRYPVYGIPGSGSTEFTGDWDQTTGQYLINAMPPPCSSTQGAPCIPGGVLPANVMVTPYGHRSLHANEYGNFSPRVGVAYHPYSKTTFTAGYGRFYDDWATVVQLASDLGGNWPAVTSLQLTATNTSTVTAPLADPFGQGSGITTTPATPFANSGFFFDPKLRQPYNDQWNVGVEQGFGKSTLFSLAYVGATGRDLTQSITANLATYPAAGDAAQVAARRPFPYMIPTAYNADNGKSNYQALQASLKQTESNGLVYLLSYTWSKSLDNGCSGSFATEDCDIQDPYDLASAKGVSGFDLPQVFTASINYALPYGVGRSHRSDHVLVNEVLGGWNLGSIFGLQSGDPLTPEVDSDVANIGASFVLPDVASNPIPANQTHSEWFVPGSLVAPPAYTFGDYRRNSLRGPAHVGDIDMSLFKVFSLYGESSLQLRADVFGILNHPVLGNPAITVGAATFGTITTASDNRTLQLAAKISF